MNQQPSLAAKHRSERFHVVYIARDRLEALALLRAGVLRRLAEVDRMLADAALFMGAARAEKALAAQDKRLAPEWRRRYPRHQQPDLYRRKRK